VRSRLCVLVAIGFVLATSSCARRKALHEAVTGLEALASATRAGVTYQNYMDRKIAARIPVEAYLNEYGKDAPLATALQDALRAYDGAGTLWSYCIELSVSFILKNNLRPEVEEVLEQFPGLLKLGDEETIPRGEALSYLWQQAETAIAAARKGME
jgi:hypothetical protein